MSAAKHTPGPWRYQPGFLTVYTCSHGETGITQAIAKPLDGNGDFNPPTMEANARLISAAPDLLEALKDAVSSLEYVNTHHPEATGCGVRQERIEAGLKAIAKAEGAQP